MDKHTMKILHDFRGCSGALDAVVGAGAAAARRVICLNSGCTVGNNQEYQTYLTAEAFFSFVVRA